MDLLPVLLSEMYIFLCFECLTLLAIIIPYSVSRTHFVRLPSHGFIVVSGLRILPSNTYAKLLRFVLESLTVEHAKRYVFYCTDAAD